MTKPVAAEQPGPLTPYRAKRDFDITAEPRGESGSSAAGPGLCGLIFVIQKHAASHLHYDFRLELGGVLMSWAVPKGPSLDPADKRLAIHVEDHPLSYAAFEGTIPPRQYGAGTVIVWDKGTWEPVGDPHDALAKGKLLFKLHGQKLGGLWELVRLAKPGDKPNQQEAWILFKKRGDAFARSRADYDVVTALPDSVIVKPHEPHKPPKRAAPGRKAPLPDKLPPQLATLATGVPLAGDWLYEIKFDGYRLLARIDRGKASLITRGGHDWSDKFPKLVAEIESLGVQSAWLDGEIVVLDESGLPSFSRLQKALESSLKPASKRMPDTAGIDYFLFDLPYLEGYDLRDVPLIERRRLLKALLDEKGRDHEHLRFSADFPGDPASVLESACRMKLEGVIAKRTDAPYASRRTETWLKLKCKLRQEFVIAGYTDRSDGSAQIGSLLLGLYDEGGAKAELISVGSVGTGWDATEASELKRKLAKLEIPTTPFTASTAKPGRWSRRVAGSERWVKPKLVAEVEYAQMTADGQLRHASYVALRADKAPQTIHREIAKTPVGAALLRVTGKTANTSMNSIQVTHAERVIDTSTGLTKLDLVRYYESVADFMLPHLKGRPCSLLRGPAGVASALFFQKHSARTAIPGVKNMDPALWPDHDALLEVATPAALAGAAQMNVIEFHTWNSTAKHITKPDRMIFDLDPGEGTPWTHIQEAAILVRGFLQELGLESWLKTSGGKGLHVVVPLAPKLDYDTVNQFSKAVVEHLVRVIPSRFVAKSGAANRIGKLFVDYLRNGQGATTVAAFSARARPGLGVSMPIHWDALPQLKSSAQWTITTAREHLSFQTIDPWADYWKAKQTLTVGMRKLGLKDRSGKARSP